MELERKTEMEKYGAEKDEPLIGAMLEMEKYGYHISCALNYVVERLHQGKTNKEIRADIRNLLKRKHKYKD